jgi:hypothetical protein
VALAELVAESVAEVDALEVDAMGVGDAEGVELEVEGLADEHALVVEPEGEPAVDDEPDAEADADELEPTGVVELDAPGVADLEPEGDFDAAFGVGAAAGGGPGLTGGRVGVEAVGSIGVTITVVPLA